MATKDEDAHLRARTDNEGKKQRPILETKEGVLGCVRFQASRPKRIPLARHNCARKVRMTLACTSVNYSFLGFPQAARPCTYIGMRRTSTRPEHTKVRLPIIDELLQLGWKEGQILWSPEWRVPKNPNSASKREAGESFDAYPVDIAVFDSIEHRGDYRYLLFIVETKEPKIQAGKSQLETYLSLEPYAKLGIWTNGAERVAIFRTADGSFEHDTKFTLPRPDESLLRAAPKLLTYVCQNISNLRSAVRRFLCIGNRDLNVSVSILADGKLRRGTSPHGPVESDETTLQGGQTSPNRA